MMEEVWKDIKGFEGRYQVSNLGRVKSLARMVHHRASNRTKGFDCLIHERIMKLHLSNSGYLFVTFNLGCSTCGKFIHRLVADAFIPNPDNLPEVNHKDENKLNNVVCFNPDGSLDIQHTNLEWCTPSYNMRYGKIAVVRQRGNIRNRKPIIQMTLDGIFVRKYKSIKDMYRITGINREGVSRMCRGLKKYRNGSNLISVGGYKWKFAD